ncbi:hypothetical protein [Candidatus Poriferisodalis sp.]|uniref:hypothetical protein n=1 Tax=Candidatus Poriferisodalis sp. TaxID=3101277 RepID=UPI003D0A7D5A
MLSQAQRMCPDVDRLVDSPTRGHRRDLMTLRLAAFEILLLEALSQYRQTGAPARHLRDNYAHLCDKLGFEYIC